MAYPAATPPGTTSGRPRVVTAAIALLILTAVALIVDAVALIAGAGQYPARVREAIEQSDVDPRAADAMEPVSRFMSTAVIAVTLIAATVLVILAAIVARGSFAARVVTWVAVGLALLCNICGLGSAGAGFSGVAYVSAFSRDASGQHTFAQRLPAGYPDWYQPLSLGLALVCLVALIFAGVLLAVPTANAYFRKPKPLLVPATGGWVAPGHPAPIAPDQRAQLAELNRKHLRGELTNEQYLAEQNRLLGRD
jgi:hypothetical protein